jgi:hypothetical protein
VLDAVSVCRSIFSACCKESILREDYMNGGEYGFSTYPSFSNQPG